MISLKDVIAPSFYDTHKAIKAGTVNEAVEKGGRGGAKSSFVSVELILQLLRHPNCHAAVFRKVGNTLRTSVYAQIRWAIGALGLTHKFRCTVSPMECTYLPTGQKIMFFGLDDPAKVKSIKTPFGYIGIAWFEELDQYSSAEEIRNVEQSLFRGGSFSLRFKSFNPPAMARNWANKYALESKSGKLVHHSTYLDVPQAWLGETFLDDAEHLKNTNEIAYRHEYLGEVVGSGTAVFENLLLEPISDEQIAQFDPVLNGVDWGWYPDPFAFNRMHYDAARRTLYIFDELTRRRTGNRETAGLVLERMLRGRIYVDSEGKEAVSEPLRLAIRQAIGRMPTDAESVEMAKKIIIETEDVVADSAEEKSIADYRSFGIRCRGAEKGPGSVAYSMKWLQALACIVIDPERCPDTAKEFTEYEYERDKKTQEVMEGYPDVNNHHIDAVRYATNRVWRRRGQ